MFLDLQKISSKHEELLTDLFHEVVKIIENQTKFKQCVDHDYEGVTLSSQSGHILVLIPWESDCFIELYNYSDEEEDYDLVFKTKDIAELILKMKELTK